jgi:hypothetical protein
MPFTPVPFFLKKSDEHSHLVAGVHGDVAGWGGRYYRRRGQSPLYRSIPIFVDDERI